MNGQVLTVAEGKIGTKGGAVRGARLESASMSESEGTLEEQALMRPGLAEVSARPQGGSHLQRADPQRIPRGYEGKEGQLGVEAMGTVEIKTGEHICDRIEVSCFGEVGLRFAGDHAEVSRKRMPGRVWTW